MRIPFRFLYYIGRIFFNGVKYNKSPQSEGLIKEEQIHTIGSFINKKEKKMDETIFFKSVGMALLDLYVAKTIYEKAIELNVGQKIEI